MWQDKTCYVLRRPFTQRNGRNTPDKPAGQVPGCPSPSFLCRPAYNRPCVVFGHKASPHAFAERQGQSGRKSVAAHGSRLLWCRNACPPESEHGHTRPYGRKCVRQGVRTAARTLHTPTRHLLYPSNQLLYGDVPIFRHSAGQRCPEGYFLQK